jgi:hypothetical protein
MCDSLLTTIKCGLPYVYAVQFVGRVGSLCFTPRNDLPCIYSMQAYICDIQDQFVSPFMCVQTIFVYVVMCVQGMR